MSFPEEEASNHTHKTNLDLNQAFFDFSQDFQQKYNSHQLLSFPEENEDPPFQVPSFQMNPPNHAFSQNDPEGHINSTAFLFNGLESKERQPSRQLNSNIRLDCSPELKVGVKGSSRFFSFDPEDDGLNCFWGGKNNINAMNSEEINGGINHQEKEAFIMKTEEKETNEEQNLLLESQKDLFYDNVGGRSSRGLRVLSLKVKEIVCEKKETSYKEVAEILVQGLNMKDMDMGKDEQNVKRRVYDALNVLIAADVLKKKGKRVVSDQNSSLKGKSLTFQNKFEKANYEELRRKIKENVKNKTEKLRDIVNKTIGLQFLINRNKAFPVKIEENREVLTFPFIAIENQCEEQIKCVSSKEKKDFAIFFKNGFAIYGDMDVLLKLEFHERGKHLAETVIEECGGQKLL